MKNKIYTFLTAAALLASALAVQASTITLGGTTGGLERQATLGANAVAGGYGDGNPQAADISGIFGGSWTKVNSITPDSGNTDGFLTVNLLTGSWGGQPVITGTWSIASAFYANYSTAVISLHVGDAKISENPDFFAWKIADDGLSGTWSYDANIAHGGGLSNIQLWGSGTPHVPDGGMTAALLVMGLACVGLVARGRKHA